MTSLIDRALGSDWERLRRKFPAHLQRLLPSAQEGQPANYQMVRLALRERVKWSRAGKPKVPVSGDAVQVEREWWGLMLMTGAATPAQKPSAPPIDRIHANGDIEMKQSAPGTPRPRWVGRVSASQADRWRQTREFGAVKMDGKWTNAVLTPTESGRHAEVRHDVCYPDMTSLFKLLGAEMRVQPRAGEVANNWNWGHDRRTHALIAAWHAGRLQLAQGRGARRVEIYDALDRLKELSTADPMGDLAHAELVHWLSDRITAAKRPAGGRMTVKMAADLLLHRGQLLRRIDDRALLQILTLQVRSAGRPSHHERCRQAVVSLTPPIFESEREIPNALVFFFDHEQKTGT